MARILPLCLLLASATVARGNPEMEVDLPGGATMVFLWVESGTFLMGSADDDATRASGETPRHEVTLTQGYWLANTRSPRRSGRR